jgi:hypothetical protein
MKNKRGIEYGLTILIVIIGLVVALGVFLLVWNRLSFTEQIDKETCKQSVLQRSIFNAGPFEVGKKVISLDCKTEKICVSESGKDCADASGGASGFMPAKNNPVTKVMVRGRDTKLVAMDTLANALYDCHDMLGRGKLNFMPNTFWKEKYCLICSRVAFDEQARKNAGKISYVDFLKYMESKKDSAGISYLKVIYNTDSADVAIEQLEGLLDILNKEGPKQGYPTVSSVNDLNIDLSGGNGIAIVSQLIPYSTAGAWVKGGFFALTVGGIAAGIILAPATGGGSLALTVASIKAVVVGGALGAASFGVGYVYTFPDGAAYEAPKIYPYEVDMLRALECSSFETAP